MSIETIGAAALGALIIILLIEVRRAFVTLNRDMRDILNHELEIRRRLDLLERERRK